MFKALEVIDLPDQNQVLLRLRRGEESQTAPPIPFGNPLNQSLNQEIGWYFQDYLQDPFGDSGARAQEVETSLRNLGRLMFEAVFRGNQEAQSYYSTAVAEGLDGYPLTIVSNNPSFLALPWELLNEPNMGYLASQLPSVLRQVSMESLPKFDGPLPAEQLNVLLVSPVASGESGISTLAAEALDVLESLEVQVELDYLRPPTFAALTEHLSSRTKHYHLVHFDGIFSSGSDSLLFETAEDGIEPVPATRVAGVLAAAGVPIVLLNAGKTDTPVVQDSWPAAAAGLAAGGVPLVVSLPFHLSSPARELFLQPFYRAIVQGQGVPLAVAQARQVLMGQPHRHSPSGEVILWDWIGPTVYQSQTYTPTPITAPAPDPAGSPGIPAGDSAGREDQLPQGGPYGLVGRKSELRDLERLFQRGPVVLLSGPTGVGKTELALGLARWLSRTGSRPGGVFYTTFEVGAGVERIVHEVGTSVAGLDFADMPAQQQRRWLVEYYRDHPSLLICDGLENAAGFPSSGAGLLDESEQSELDNFLGEVAEGGQTWVLLVSRRKEEPWLYTPHLEYGLPGLGRHDALELGNKILRQAGVFDSLQGSSAESRLGPDYFRLLELVEGHPLAMQIGLPLLKEVPASLLENDISKGIAQLGPGDGEEARPPYLTALMDLSFSRMSHRSRVHLPFLSLFQRRVILDILTHITQERVYRTVMGEELGWGACRTMLRSAREAGFIEPVTPSIYQIHLSFPWFYGRQLHRQVAASGVRRLEEEFVRVYTDTADHFMETLYENQDAGATAVLAEEGNLTQAVGLALEAKQWDSAQILVQPLAQVYRMQKRYPELRRLRRQLLETVAPSNGGASEAESGGGIDLWLYLVGTEASEAADLGELDYGEELNRQLLTYLTSQPGGDEDPRVAAVDHQLGVIAQRRWQLDEAEEWFLKSLAIIEHGEDTAVAADDYHSLGQVMQYQRRYTEAQEWFKKSLEIHQRLQDEEEMVKDYRSLGLTSQYKFEYDEAESWYQRARDIVEEHRDEETAILIYHELATVHHARYSFDEAETLYQQALNLSEQLGKQDQMAVEFHHLGLLAQNRELFYEDAENWFLLALEKYEALGDRRSAGDECRQLGVLFHEQKKLDEAEHWYLRARDLFDEARDVQRTARTYGQLGMVAEDRGDLPGALEWVARTYSLAIDHDLPLLTQVKSHLGRLRDKYGTDQFTKWWQGFLGVDPPTDLDADTSSIL